MTTFNISTNYLPLAKCFTYEEVETLVTLKHLFVNTNADDTLFIYKYGKMCQYAQNWNRVTLACRGLVLDKDGKIVGRGFGKFFNMEELNSDAQKVWESKIKKGLVRSFEKLDGSLGLFFLYQGKLMCTTQGSFQSDQCVYAIEKLLSKEQKFAMINFLNGVRFGRTILCEIIYRENTIVVKYDSEKLVLLGSVDNKTGQEFNAFETGNLNEFFEVPNEIELTDWKTLKAMNLENQEGFVLTDYKGQKVKIKFDDYCLLHKSKTSITTKSIWESLKTFGEIPEEILEDIPDEAYQEIKNLVLKFKTDFNATKDSILEISEILKNVETQKEFAFFVQSQELNRIGKNCLFSLRNGKEIDSLIWESLKPDFKKIF